MNNLYPHTESWIMIAESTSESCSYLVLSVRLLGVDIADPWA